MSHYSKRKVIHHGNFMQYGTLLFIKNNNVLPRKASQVLFPFADAAIFSRNLLREMVHGTKLF